MLVNDNADTYVHAPGTPDDDLTRCSSPLRQIDNGNDAYVPGTSMMTLTSRGAINAHKS